MFRKDIGITLILIFLITPLPLDQLAPIFNK